jgi:hypothetical protein
MSAAATPQGTSLDPQLAGANQQARVFQPNTLPAGVHPASELPAGFLDFLRPLQRSFGSWQEQLLAKRRDTLAAAHRAYPPVFLNGAVTNAIR